jgi:hypothetical protein
MYSYPHATPALTDIILGSKHYEEEGLVSKSFYISDIVDLVASVNEVGTLQTVSNNGNTILVDTTRSTGIDITLSNLATVYQTGFRVTIPSQTGTPYPTYNSSPDAYIAYINGQAPGTLAGSIGGCVINASGADNVSFWSNHNAGTSLSYHSLFKNVDGVTSDFATYRRIVTGVSNTEVYKVDYNGNTTANSFIKIGGTSAEFLKADGTVDTVSYIKSIYKTTIPFSTSGTTALTLCKSFQILPNTLSSSDFLDVKAFFSKLGTNGTGITSIWINSALTLSGAVQIATNNISLTSFACPISRTFYLTGTSIEGYPFNNSSSTGTEQSSTTSYGSTPYNVNNSVYVLFAMQVNNVLDSIVLKGVRITN